MSKKKDTEKEVNPYEPRDPKVIYSEFIDFQCKSVKSTLDAFIENSKSMYAQVQDNSTNSYMYCSRNEGHFLVAASNPNERANRFGIFNLTFNDYTLDSNKYPPIEELLVFIKRNPTLEYKNYFKPEQYVLNASMTLFNNQSKKFLAFTQSSIDLRDCLEANVISNSDVQVYTPQADWKISAQVAKVLHGINLSRQNEKERLKVFMSIDSNHNNNLSKDELYYYYVNQIRSIPHFDYELFIENAFQASLTPSSDELDYEMFKVYEDYIVNGAVLFDILHKYDRITLTVLRDNKCDIEKHCQIKLKNLSALAEVCQCEPGPSYHIEYIDKFLRTWKDMQFSSIANRESFELNLKDLLFRCPSGEYQHEEQEALLNYFDSDKDGAVSYKEVIQSFYNYFNVHLPLDGLLSIAYDYCLQFNSSQQENSELDSSGFAVFLKSLNILFRFLSIFNKRDGTTFNISKNEIDSNLQRLKAEGIVVEDVDEFFNKFDLDNNKLADFSLFYSWLLHFYLDLEYPDTNVVLMEDFLVTPTSLLGFMYVWTGGLKSYLSIQNGNVHYSEKRNLIKIQLARG